MVAAVLVSLVCGPALALNGYFQLGQSAEQRSMAGTGTALAGDPAQMISNPAGILGGRRQIVTDLNILYVNINAEAGARGDPSAQGIFSIDPGKTHSSAEWFPVPVVAFTVPIDDVSSWGLAIHGGGLKSKYTEGGAQFAPNVPLLAAQCEGNFGGGAKKPGTTDVLGFCGEADPNASVGLIQVYFRPGYARRLSDTVSVGISPIVVAQAVRIRGLSAFAPYSVDASRVTDKGLSQDISFGARFGVQAAPLPWFSIGGSYQTRMRTQFSDYSGFLPDGGRLDIPEMWNIGVALRPATHHLVAIDFERINFSDVPAFGRPLDPNAFTNECLLPRLLAPRPESEACLGGDRGPGLGQRDVLSYRIGYRWKATDRLEISTGYGYTRFPNRASETLLNQFVPPTTPHHFAAGFTLRRDAESIYNFALMYTPPHKLTGKNPLSSTDANVAQLLTGAVLPGGPGLENAFGPDANDQDITISMELVEVVFGFTFDW